MTNETGIHFQHHTGTSEEKPFPAANGSGLASIDYDLDGRYDIYFATGTPFPVDTSRVDPHNELYRNLGGNRFRDISTVSGLAHAGYTAGVGVGDYDNDGFPDIYLGCYGNNVLLHNQGDGTFAVVRSGAEDSRWATSVAFLDYDSDGLLDLYVCNYAKWSLETNRYCGDVVKKIRLYCSPSSVEPEDSVLFHNEGDGTFRDASESSRISVRKGRAQGVVATDFNGDGWIDVYVGNDLHPNSLFVNNRDGTFRDASESSGAAYDAMGNSQAGMGVDAGDVDGDGRPDLFVTNFEGEYNTLYLNTTETFFQDTSKLAGVAADSMSWVGWGTMLVDFDQDGWLDIVVTNGHVDNNRHLMGQKSQYLEPPLAYRNDRGRFRFLGASAGDYFGENHVGRGLAIADWNNDGFPDVAIGHQDDKPAILQNIVGSRGGTPVAGKLAPITLRLIGRASNRDAVGTSLKFTIPTSNGEPLRFLRQIKGGGSYLSAHDLRLHIPAFDDLTVTAEIRWPNRSETAVTGLRPGRSYLVIEPDAATEGRGDAQATVVEIVRL